MSIVEKIDEFLNEGKTIVTIDTDKALRPGTKNTYNIVKDHGKDSKGSTIYTVKQPNGAYGVMTVNHKTGVVTGVTQKNHDEKTSLEIGEHIKNQGLVNLKHAWYVNPDKKLA